MGKRLIERQLKRNGARLRSLREELQVTDEQLGHLSDDAADAALRALVSENPGVGYEGRKAQEHADAMGSARLRVVAEIRKLEQRQDQLLDALSAS